MSSISSIGGSSLSQQGALGSDEPDDVLGLSGPPDLQDYMPPALQRLVGVCPGLIVLGWHAAPHGTDPQQARAGGTQVGSEG